ncbi:putative quinidine resistance protein [Elsinoe fawcettii]|nr:putative quinidine resistance protein [Elsinoe fawcettii]
MLDDRRRQDSPRNAEYGSQIPLQTQPYTIFDHRQRPLIIAVVSFAATFTGFASNIYFPVLPTLARDFNVSVELINLTVTTYLIFQGLAPSLWGPISDVKGRRVAYIFTFLVFLSACIGLAEARNYATLITLRCLQSAGSASTIAIGSGVVGDITTADNRGRYMGFFQAGPLVAVAIGPIIGGSLAGSLGWRSIFWFLTIYGGAFLVILICLLPETLRVIVGNGSRISGTATRYPLSFYQRTTKIGYSPSAETGPRKAIDYSTPFRVLFRKEVAPHILFVAIHYGVWQMSITAMSSLFDTRYELSPTQIGLTFIANGLGSMIGSVVTGKLLDLNYRRLCVGNSDDPGDRLKMARLQLVPLFSIVQSAAILIFGWTIRYSVHIALPITTTFVTGWTTISTQLIVLTYMVDIYPQQSAAASAGVNIARCLLAAGGTSVVMLMIAGVDTGWTFTICAAVQLVALVGIVAHLGLVKLARTDQESANAAETCHAN